LARGGIELSGVAEPCGGFDASGVLLGAAESGVELVEEPELPETLPAVLPLELPGVAALALLTAKSLSFTFLTPGTALAIFLASFLSSLFATVPVSVTVPLSTATWTFCRFGLVASCS
jgi:hypothetical protein